MVRQTGKAPTATALRSLFRPASPCIASATARLAGTAAHFSHWPRCSGPPRVFVLAIACLLAVLPAWRSGRCCQLTLFPPRSLPYSEWGSAPSHLDGAEKGKPQKSRRQGKKCASPHARFLNLGRSLGRSLSAPAAPSPPAKPPRPPTFMLARYSPRAPPTVHSFPSAASHVQLPARPPLTVAIPPPPVPGSRLPAPAAAKSCRRARRCSAQTRGSGARSWCSASSASCAPCRATCLGGTALFYKHRPSHKYTLHRKF